MEKDLKDILLKDLCSRLPYGVKVQSYSYEYGVETIETLREIDSDGYMSTLECETLKYIAKPYLFPLSSMTEEQCHEFYCRFVENEIDYNDFKEYYFDNGLWHKVLTSIDDCSEVIDWFNKNHFDYRGLIEKGLANDATNKNIY